MRELEPVYGCENAESRPTFLPFLRSSHPSPLAPSLDSSTRHRQALFLNSVNLRPHGLRPLYRHGASPKRMVSPPPLQAAPLFCPVWCLFPRPCRCMRRSSPPRRSSPLHLICLLKPPGFTDRFPCTRIFLSLGDPLAQPPFAATCHCPLADLPPS
jgi:hypothetical protein